MKGDLSWALAGSMSPSRKEALNQQMEEANGLKTPGLDVLD
jgi:hypothetical protein